MAPVAGRLHFDPQCCWNFCGASLGATAFPWPAGPGSSSRPTGPTGAAIPAELPRAATAAERRVAQPGHKVSDEGRKPFRMRVKQLAVDKVDTILPCGPATSSATAHSTARYRCRAL